MAEKALCRLILPLKEKSLSDGRHSTNQGRSDLQNAGRRTSRTTNPLKLAFSPGSHRQLSSAQAYSAKKRTQTPHVRSKPYCILSSVGAAPVCRCRRQIVSRAPTAEFYTLDISYYALGIGVDMVLEEANWKRPLWTPLVSVCAIHAPASCSPIIVMCSIGPVLWPCGPCGVE